MENKVYKFGYEDTDKKIEIDLYGLVFEIKNMDKKKVEELDKMDRKDITVLEQQLETILGKGSIDKINEKRLKDGYDKLTIDIELAIFGCIFNAYYSATTGNFVDKIKDTANNIENNYNDVENLIKNKSNREQRRNYNRNNYYRRNRRRY